MVQALEPEDKRVFILTHKGRAIVARYLQTGKRRFMIQYATNWETLEPEAVEVVEELAASVYDIGHYPCPPDLAVKALFAG